jgi:hypothetical protein
MAKRHDGRHSQPEPVQISIGGPVASKALRVASYNMLGPSLLAQNPELYRASHPAALTPAHRLPLLLAQIEALNADVLGLQELEDYEQWEPRFESLGYASLYKRRTGAQRDGVALLWRRSRLQLCEAQAIEYRACADGLVGVEAEQARKDNVGLLAVLRDGPSGGHELVVGSTHVLWNPKRGLVKLRQLREYAARAHALAAARPGAGVRCASLSRARAASRRPFERELAWPCLTACRRSAGGAAGRLQLHARFAALSVPRRSGAPHPRERRAARRERHAAAPTPCIARPPSPSYAVLC